jgi:hypothetical protein
MKTLGLSRDALAIGAASASLAGCGGSQPLGAPGAIAQRSNAHIVSPFLRQKADSAAEVQFVTYNQRESRPRILEFDYPKGTAPIRHWRLSRRLHPTAACTGGSHTFWVVFSKETEIQEFSVGSEKPLKTLTVTGGRPTDCAVDPTTGDLAVPIGGTSSVVRFPNGSGSGQVISDKLSSSWYTTYDGSGNLFVNGFYESKFQLAELPKGSADFKILSFSNSNKVQDPLFSAMLRWDGTHLAMYWMGNYPVIYRYRASGGVAKLEGVVHGMAQDAGSIWISRQAGLLFCAQWADGGYVYVYHYPAGGKPIARFDPVIGSEGIASVKP